MKKAITLSILLSLFISLEAQQYVFFEDTAKGKIFYNKNLPVYFWLSTTPDDNSGDYLLPSPTPQYANPYYFDTEGVNTFHVKGVKSAGEAVFEIYSDGYPPAIQVYPYKLQKVGHKYVFTSTSKLKVRAIDYVSGVDKIFYKVDQGQYQIWNGTIDTAIEGRTTLQFYATDRAGNSSKTKKLRLVVDLKAPSVDLALQGNKTNGYYRQNPVIKVNAEDGMSGIDKIVCKVGNRHFYSDGSQLVIDTAWADGAYSVECFAQDKAGNVSPKSTIDFVIDTKAPVVDYKFSVSEKKGQVVVVDSSATLRLIAKDNLSGVDKIYYKTSLQQNFSRYSKALSFENFVGKNLTVSFYAVDKAGNKSAIKSLKIKVAAKPKVSEE